MNNGFLMAPENSPAAGHETICLTRSLNGGLMCGSVGRYHGTTVEP